MRQKPRGRTVGIIRGQRRQIRCNRLVRSLPERRPMCDPRGLPSTLAPGLMTNCVFVGWHDLALFFTLKRGFSAKPSCWDLRSPARKPNIPATLYRSNELVSIEPTSAKSGYVGAPPPIVEKTGENCVFGRERGNRGALRKIRTRSGAVDVAASQILGDSDVPIMTCELLHGLSAQFPHFTYIDIHSIRAFANAPARS
jgi:hypothetical protein